MINKPNDVLYCGVDEDKINRAEPVINSDIFKKFVHFVGERYSVHIKKDILKQEPPYTDDEIISTYRFTNIRREHDKETKWLIANVINGDISLENKILNSILFRIYNKHETAEMLNMPIDFNNFKPSDYVECVSHKDKLFNSAFMTSGMKAGIAVYTPEDVVEDVAIRPLYTMEHIVKIDLADKLINAENQLDCYSELLKINGFSSFLAYQMFVDFTYIKEFPFSENEFTILGPGAKCGLDFLFKDKDSMSYEEALFWLRDNFNNLLSKYGLEDPTESFTDLRQEDRIMNIMSLENCMCELSKYVKIGRGEGRRRKYK